jgi:hypothetical protein
VIIADGYHRLSAVYSLYEDADIPCKILWVHKEYSGLADEFEVFNLTRKSLVSDFYMAIYSSNRNFHETWLDDCYRTVFMEPEI